MAGRVGEKGDVLGEHGRVLNVHMAGESTDGDVIAGVAHVRQIIDPADIDQHRRLRKAQLHERHQAVASGKEFGLVAVLAE
jgi:hypothetical protein